MTFREKVNVILAVSYRGIHNVPGKIGTPRWADCIEVTVPIDPRLSTFDGDILTRLVIACHDYAVRLYFRQGPPRRITLCFHERKKVGESHERHPPIEEAIAKTRYQYPEENSDGNHPNQVGCKAA